MTRTRLCKQLLLTAGALLMYGGACNSNEPAAGSSGMEAPVAGNASPATTGPAMTSAGPGSSPEPSGAEEGPPATLIDTIHADNGNILRFYRSHDGAVSIVETGDMSGTGSYLQGSTVRSAAALWRALAPERAVPADVLADEQSVLRLRNGNPKRTLSALPPANLAPRKTDCSCGSGVSAGQLQGPFCWYDMTYTATFQRFSDWILGEATVCNRASSSGAIRVKIAYRTWWSWSTLFDDNVSPGHFINWHRFSPYADFDWGVWGTVTSPATWDMVNSGGTRCIPGNNWCTNDCNRCG
jgi:hypothetical protein